MRYQFFVLAFGIGVFSLGKVELRQVMLMRIGLGLEAVERGV